uniref:C-type lectin domain-containing protein n=1 Tax=Pygocentrus nattereri TaxID=42514 RepID=A0A3B4DPT1_PYGNA
MDLNTGMLKEHTSEMDRRVAVYNYPSNYKFRQGTENSQATLVDMKTGQPLAPLSEMQRRTAVSKGTALCQGEVIDGKCYLFNPDLLTFSEAEASCKRLSSLGHLASVTSADLHAHLVTMVTRAKSDRVLTWLGGIMKNSQFEWIDGSSWGYSDWMPGHPRLLKQKTFCMEMFRIDESWWTAADCGLKRASICSYPVMP